MPSDSSPLRLTLEVLGSRVQIQLEGDGAGQLAEAVRRAWEGCLRDTGDAPSSRVVRVIMDSDPERVAAATGDGQIVGSDESTVMEWLTARVTLEAIESQHGRMWMLHACGLANPVSGAAVVLVAPSGMGKTTAARVLGRTSGYLSDETVAIGPDGSITAYPKPLSLLEGGVRPKRQRSPRELGLLDAPEQPWLAALALLDRRGAGDDATSAGAVVTMIRTVEALPALAAQTSALQRLPEPLHLMAAHLERTGGLRSIAYQDVSQLAPVVTDLMATR